MDSLLDRLRAFAAIYGLEFFAIYDEDTETQSMFFNKLGYKDIWSITFDEELLAALPSKLTENCIYDQIVAGVNENLLNKKESLT